MRTKDSTKNAKHFLNGINLNEIRSIINNINFSPLEKNVIDCILRRESIKEISVKLNYSMSYIAFVKSQVYKKISAYLLEFYSN